MFGMNMGMHMAHNNAMNMHNNAMNMHNDAMNMHNTAHNDAMRMHDHHNQLAENARRMHQNTMHVVHRQRKMKTDLKNWSLINMDTKETIEKNLSYSSALSKARGLIKKGVRVKIEPRAKVSWLKSQPIIILPCSAKKIKTKSKIPASDLYAGPLWTSYRKIPLQVIEPQEFVLSAKFGLIPFKRKIGNYDTLLGRDISAEKLTKKVKGQLRRLKLPSNLPIYAFVGRDYAKVLQEAGLDFFYVKGGIGDKRKRLKKLYKDGSLPKKDVEVKG